MDNTDSFLLPHSLADVNLMSLCRTCLSSEGAKVSLEDRTDLEDIWKEIAAFTLEREEGLPTDICRPCMDMINSCLHFRFRCQQADETLRKLLTQQRVQNKLVLSRDTSPFVVNSEDTIRNIDKNDTIKCNANSIKLFGCKYCNYSTKFKSEYIEHRQSVHSTIEKLKKIKSNDALLIRETNKNNILINKGSLNHNRISDLNENIFKCNFCDYTGSSKLLILTHGKVHCAPKTFQCDHCKFQTNLRTSLQAHVRIHTGEKPYLCSQCHLKFTQLAHLKQHQLTHSTERPFSCEHCSYRAKAKRHLDNHLKTHSGDRPFMCDSCSFRCANKVNLMSHKRSHSDVKLFQCKLCPYSSNFKKNLSMHLAKHSGVKAFECELCDYRGSCAQNLKAHMTSHSNERKFACADCNFRTKTASMLKKHAKTHGANR